MNLPIKYPLFNTKLKKLKGQTYIFDEVRKKWLVLSPEEWVRQHLIHFLIKQKFSGNTVTHVSLCFNVCISFIAMRRRELFFFFLFQSTSMIAAEIIC